MDTFFIKPGLGPFMKKKKKHRLKKRKLGRNGRIIVKKREEPGQERLNSLVYRGTEANGEGLTGDNMYGWNSGGK